MTWRALADRLLASLFQPPCAACKRPLAAPLAGAVCAECWTALKLSKPLQHRDFAAPVSWWCAVDHYEGRMKEIIHALKYERRRSIAPQLGSLMREVGSPLLADADVVVPVPLHPRREYDRGFNQAEDLARHLGVPLARMLKRVKHTHSQIELPRHARALNVRAAFELEDREAPDHAPRVVILIDDVATTGSTLAECAKVLKRAGAQEIRALTAARVVNERR
jgi:ComF family protein